MCFRKYLVCKLAPPLPNDVYLIIAQSKSLRSLLHFAYITFVVATITFKVAVITSTVANITFVVIFVDHFFVG